MSELPMTPSQPYEPPAVAERDAIGALLADAAAPSDAKPDN